MRGIKDYLVCETYILQKIEEALKKILFSYGYNEIRIPILEETFLFKHAIGEITDVVEKEMFSFKNKKGYSLTLRPEGTAGCIRAGIQHSLFYHQEQKLWYIGPMFRYERPQMGRYRQFYQLGVEVFGLLGPNIDAELILMSSKFWEVLNISNQITLHINSIGSFNSRLKYRDKLIIFLEKNKNFLDKECQLKLHKNPLRILDSKNPKVQDLLKNAPKLYDYIDQKSNEHFVKLCYMLDQFGIKYNINKNLIRGLDYYNNTVFEWITDKLGAQGTVCAGGRYDILVERLGGPKTPGIGFAIGIDRLFLLINQNLKNVENNIDLYVFISNNEIEIFSILLLANLREKWKNFSIVMHHSIVNDKKIFFIARKKQVRYVLFIKAKNIKQKKFFLKNIKTNQEININENELINELPKLLID